MSNGTGAFTAEVFQNEYLATGADTVDAVITVAATGTSAGPVPETTSRVELIIIDCSGSMDHNRKIHAARNAASVAVDCLDDGVEFAVLAGRNSAHQVYPRQGLAVASATTRREAQDEVSRLGATGGTAIGSWLYAAWHLADSRPASNRHAILLTDGRNESESAEYLAQVVESCRGTFQCDCRGVGTDWEVDELRRIATALLGTVDIVADPEDLADDFESMILASQSRGIADVSMRLWAPQGAEILHVSQVAPEILELKGAASPSGPLATDYLLGAWAPGDSRDYHVRIKVRPGAVGDEMLCGRVSLLLGDGSVATQALVRAVWTEDTELSTRINRAVAHYTGQEELAAAIQEGLAAAKAGDEATATVRLGKAMKLATESGNDDTVRLLSKVVDPVDVASGTVRLRPAAKADEMQLDTRSTRTVRLGGKKS
jgi:hypothetical protein